MAGGEALGALAVDLAYFVRNEDVYRLPQGLGRRIAEDDLGALAEKQNPQVLVRDDDALGRDVQDAAEDVFQGFGQAGLNRQGTFERASGMTPAGLGVMRSVLTAAMGVFHD